MRVEVLCAACSDDYLHKIGMEPVGPLVVSEDKTQSQEYKCRFCHKLVMVSINTMKEQKFD